MEHGLPTAADAVQPMGRRPSWLVETEAYFREKHPVFLKQLANVGGIPENSPFLKLLGAGMQYKKRLLKMQETQKLVNYVGHANANLRLVRTQDTRKELVFPPYCKAGKVVGKYIHWRIVGLPEYDGIMVPKEYGEICGAYAIQVMESRYEIVVEFLTQYHRYYVRKSMGTEKSKIGKNQGVVAEIRYARQPTVSPQPQPLTNAVTGTAAPMPQPQPVMETDGGAAPPTAIPSPMVTSPVLLVEMRPCPQAQVTPKLFAESEDNLGCLESCTPHVNKKRKIEKTFRSSVDRTSFSSFHLYSKVTCARTVV